nr:ATPase [Helicobacter heilmannii]
MVLVVLLRKGLFVAEFYSKIVENCKDIHTELEKVSQSYGLDMNDLWFDLIKVHTLTRSEPHGEFKILDAEGLKQIDDDAFYENPALEVIQRYDICIKRRLFKYFFNLEASPDDNQLYVVYESPFMIINDEWLLGELCDHIEACMAYQKIILRQMQAQHTFFKQEMVRYSNKKELPERICIRKSHYSPNKAGSFTFVLKKSWELKNGEEAPVNAIYGAGKGDVVLEYVKPIQGTSGRDLKGQIKEVEKLEAVPFELDFSNEAFVSNEEPTKIIYISKSPQYVAFINNKSLKSFTRNQYVEMKNTNMPMFLGGVENGLTLHISSKNEIDNAIETNLRIEAKEIYIRGNVGKHVKLVAKKIIIEGQLHTESSAEAEEVLITNNKGLCKGKKVQCKYVDRGTIFAESCEVEASSGSQIYAKDIKLKQIKSNNTFYFSSKCEFEAIDGSDNKFCFSAFASPENKEILEQTKQAMNVYKEKAQKVMAQYQKLSIFVQKNQPTIDKIRNADITTRKVLIEQDAIKQIYYDFMDCLKRVKILHMYISRIQELNRQFLERLVSIESSMQQVKVHTNGPWTAFNTIIYARTYTKGSKSLTTEKGETADYILDTQSGDVKKISRYQHITSF